ncbi:NADPH:quinone reductase [Pseudomonas sp. LS-2]|jgi:NADPH2:quinone reductase|uniref:NADPH:quinone reductase n=1 Tax=Pseudomonas sp. LS-2 TaxID=2315859 RepID=UPI000E717FE4|nr:NADPH:quinone reductase [Pseudomonas sp. LS-2]RJX76566.1 NADPH:quinone reductase [Pseudomonas sp. LS-2]
MAKRIQFRTHGGPEVLEYVDFEPAAPGPKEVLVRNKAIGVNFIETYFRTGLYPVAAMPSGLGNEGAGVVEAVGAEVTHVKVGDRVGYGTGPLGSYADLHLTPVANVVKLPDEISFEQAAAIMLKGLTVQYLFRQTYEIRPEETILFHAAAGGVGSIACQWASAMGVKLIGTVSSPEKAAHAKANGAWEVIDYSKEDVVKRVSELTDGKKVPVVYDGVGKDTWETSLDCLELRGLLVSFGNASGPVAGVNLGILAQKGSLYVTRPTLGSYANSPETLQAMADEVFDMVITGKVKVDELKKFSLKDAAKAHTELSARRTTGSIILVP